jgi:hypothetical protein
MLRVRTWRMLTLAWFAGALLAAAAVASARNDASTTTAGAFPMNKDDPSAIAQACLQDLEAIPGFLRENDAGVQQPVSPETEDRRRAALEVARRQAQDVRDEAGCLRILQTYLGAWRHGHLSVHAMKPEGGAEMARPASGNRSPSAEMLSGATALITIPTFFPAAREPLAALLEQHRQALAARPNWIIDVRGNDGGSDTTYAPLLPWLLPDGWIDVSEKVFVTPANIRAEERICEEFAPGDADCAHFSAATVQRMRAVGDRQWVQQQYETGWRYVPPATVEPNRPQRVAVLMDGRCGSSCEQFLLTVRQSFNVKLVGHSRSGGVLDASNLRPHLLPSGRRRLWYATTLSNRLPGFPIDGIGIAPDVFLPEAGDATDRSVDVKRTQRWLEGSGW